jgi:hypothetical protein
VISNSYGASNVAGLFFTSTPSSETTDMLTEVGQGGQEWGVDVIDIQSVLMYDIA